MVPTVTKVFVLLGAFFFNIFKEALAQDDIKTIVAGAGMQCMAEHPLTMQEMHMIRNQQLPETAYCLIDCTLKKSQMTDSEGKLDLVHVRDLTQQLFANDPDRLQHANALIDACSHVNDEPAGDGCARAALIFDCVSEQAQQHGFDM